MNLSHLIAFICGVILGAFAMFLIIGSVIVQAINFERPKGETEVFK